MTNPQLAGLTAEAIKKWLTKDEKRAYRAYVSGWKDRRGVMRMAPDKGMADTLESFARSRASEDRKRKLLKKHEFCVGSMGTHCPECWHHEGEGHKPDCAIAAELAGTGE